MAAGAVSSRICTICSLHILRGEPRVRCHVHETQTHNLREVGQPLRAGGRAGCSAALACHTGGIASLEPSARPGAAAACACACGAATASGFECTAATAAAFGRNAAAEAKVGHGAGLDVRVGGSGGLDAGCEAVAAFACAIGHGARLDSGSGRGGVLEPGFEYPAKMTACVSRGTCHTTGMHPWSSGRQLARAMG